MQKRILRLIPALTACLLMGLAAVLLVILIVVDPVYDACSEAYAKGMLPGIPVGKGVWLRAEPLHVALLEGWGLYPLSLQMLLLAELLGWMACLALYNAIAILNHRRSAHTLCILLFAAAAITYVLLPWGWITLYPAALGLCALLTFLFFFKEEPHV